MRPPARLRPAGSPPGSRRCFVRAGNQTVLVVVNNHSLSCLSVLSGNSLLSTSFPEAILDVSPGTDGTVAVLFKESLLVIDLERKLGKGIIPCYDMDVVASKSLSECKEGFDKDFDVKKIEYSSVTGLCVLYSPSLLLLQRVESVEMRNIIFPPHLSSTIEPVGRVSIDSSGKHVILSTVCPGVLEILILRNGYEKIGLFNLIPSREPLYVQAYSIYCSGKMENDDLPILWLSPDQLLIGRSEGACSCKLQLDGITAKKWCNTVVDTNEKNCLDRTTTSDNIFSSIAELPFIRGMVIEGKTFSRKYNKTRDGYTSLKSIFIQNKIYSRSVGHYLRTDIALRMWIENENNHYIVLELYTIERKQKRILNVNTIKGSIPETITILLDLYSENPRYYSNVIENQPTKECFVEELIQVYAATNAGILTLQIRNRQKISVTHTPFSLGLDAVYWNNYHLKDLLDAIGDNNIVGPEPLVMDGLQNKSFCEKTVSNKKQTPLKTISGNVIREVLLSTDDNDDDSTSNFKLEVLRSLKIPSNYREGGKEDIEPFKPYISQICSQSGKIIEIIWPTLRGFDPMGSFYGYIILKDGTLINLSDAHDFSKNSDYANVFECISTSAEEYKSLNVLPALSDFDVSSSKGIIVIGIDQQKKILHFVLAENNTASNSIEKSNDLKFHIRSTKLLSLSFSEIRTLPFHNVPSSQTTLTSSVPIAYDRTDRNIVIYLSSPKTDSGNAVIMISWRDLASGLVYEFVRKNLNLDKISKLENEPILKLEKPILSESYGMYLPPLIIPKSVKVCGDRLFLLQQRGGRDAMSSDNYVAKLTLLKNLLPRIGSVDSREDIDIQLLYGELAKALNWNEEKKETTLLTVSENGFRIGFIPDYTEEIFSCNSGNESKIHNLNKFLIEIEGTLSHALQMLYKGPISLLMRVFDEIITKHTPDPDNSEENRKISESAIEGEERLKDCEFITLQFLSKIMKISREYISDLRLTGEDGHEESCVLSYISSCMLIFDMLTKMINLSISDFSQAPTNSFSKPTENGVNYEKENQHMHDERLKVDGSYRYDLITSILRILSPPRPYFFTCAIHRSRLIPYIWQSILSNSLGFSTDQLPYSIVSAFHLGELLAPSNCLDCLNAISRYQLSISSDPAYNSCVLMACGKPETLARLYQIGGGPKGNGIAALLSRDFREEKVRKVVKKNARALLQKGRYDEAFSVGLASDPGIVVDVLALRPDLEQLLRLHIGAISFVPTNYQIYGDTCSKDKLISSLRNHRMNSIAMELEGYSQLDICCSSGFYMGIWQSFKLQEYLDKNLGNMDYKDAKNSKDNSNMLMGKSSEKDKYILSDNKESNSTSEPSLDDFSNFDDNSNWDDGDFDNIGIVKTTNKSTSSGNDVDVNINKVEIDDENDNFQNAIFFDDVGIGVDNVYNNYNIEPGNEEKSRENAQNKTILTYIKDIPREDMKVLYTKIKKVSNFTRLKRKIRHMIMKKEDGIPVFNDMNNLVAQEMAEIDRSYDHTETSTPAISCSDDSQVLLMNEIIDTKKDLQKKDNKRTEINIENLETQIFEELTGKNRNYKGTNDVDYIHYNEDKQLSPKTNQKNGSGFSNSEEMVTNGTDKIKHPFIQSLEFYIVDNEMLAYYGNNKCEIRWNEGSKKLIFINISSDGYRLVATDCSGVVRIYSIEILGVDGLPFIRLYPYRTVDIDENPSLMAFSVRPGASCILIVSGRKKKYAFTIYDVLNSRIKDKTYRVKNNE